jgi:propanediol dehydratase small subunit
MTTLAELLLIMIVVFAAGAMVERVRLRRYWQRTCTGFAWRRRFPQAPKAELRLFLSLFVDAFAFSKSRRLCFSPEDRPFEVYKALYPFPRIMADSMELETFIESIREKFGVDLLPTWREDITLGELYAAATNA